MAALAVALLVGWATTSVAHVSTKPPTKQYQASTILMNSGIGPSQQSNVGMQTLATLATIPDVLKQVATDVHYHGNPLDLQRQILAGADTQSGLLNITATSPDPKFAAQLADTDAIDLLAFLRTATTTQNAQLASAIQRQLARLNGQINNLDNQIPGATGAQRDVLTSSRDGMIVAYDQLQTEYQTLTTQAANIGSSLLIIQHAVPQEIASTNTLGLQPPKSTKIRLLLAAIVGLILGIGLALVLERFDTRIRNKKAAERSFGLPVLAEIPFVPRVRRWRLGDTWRTSKGVPVVMPSFPRVGDAFRLLGAGVSRGPLGNGDGTAGEGNGHRRGQQPSGVILITSAGPSEGKTTVVANLALTFVQAQRSVIVLSCDFQHPQIHKLFDVPNTDGLADALQAPSGAVLNGHIKSTPVRDMRLVPSGPRPKNPAGLFSSERMREAIQEARREADIVLLDTPPLLTSAEVAQLFPMVDAVLVVARAKKTTAELAERAGELLKRLDAPVVGVALNGATEIPMPSYHEKYWQVVK